ncbi:hypothetical protein [Halobaculum limi]|uniref:hypothetical protein n=1 Tax=Halobaculum limi TaxID=3031916 RepID=UPI002406FCD1|nr:hypothetical protein [Halobaculum sp. YSMS11]
MNRISRRRLLGLSAAGVCGLAGCTSTDGAAGDDQPDGSAGDEAGEGGPFASVAVEETTLVIDLREDASVEQVNVIAPDGSRIRSFDIVSGQTRVRAELGVTYAPGTYEITTESGASTSLTLEPDLVIEELGVGANNLDVMPDSLGNFEPYAATVVVRNRGTGPTGIVNLAFSGDVPNPTEDVMPYPQKSGIVDPENGVTDVEFKLIESNSSVRLFTSTVPFLFAGQEAKCSSMPSESIIRVEVSDSVTGESSTAEFDASYSAGEATCAISIEDRNT